MNYVITANVTVAVMPLVCIIAISTTLLLYSALPPLPLKPSIPLESAALVENLWMVIFMVTLAMVNMFWTTEELTSNLHTYALHKCVLLA